jgi:hypothetical protein
MRTVRRARSRAPRTDAALSAVSAAVFDIEEPLREARHLVHILAAIAQYRGEDNEAVSTVAGEASRKLELVDGHVRRLFKVLRGIRTG